MLVSVVIPMYQSVDTIERMYNSLNNQEYKEIEIIMVDNNSTDGTYEKALSIASMDPRVRVFQETKQGVSNARKKGFLESKGSYVYFVDADDVVLKYGLKIMANFASGMDADMIEGVYLRQEEEEVQDWSVDIEPTNFLQIRPGLWCHLYKRELIEEQFFVPINRYEDLLFNWFFFAASDENKRMTISTPVYRYIPTGKGLTSSHNIVSMYDLLNATSSVLKFFRSKKLLDTYEKELLLQTWINLKLIMDAIESLDWEIRVEKKINQAYIRELNSIFFCLSANQSMEPAFSTKKLK